MLLSFASSYVGRYSQRICRRPNYSLFDKNKHLISLQLRSASDFRSAPKQGRTKVEINNHNSTDYEINLTDEEAARLNKRLGFSDPTRRAARGKEMSKEYLDSNAKVRASNDRMSDVESFNLDRAEVKSSSIIRGFLEINPFICTGCGASFQSKSESEPGYLPKEIMQDHHKKATLMHERQEAIRILHAASIDLDSDVAEDLLRSANKSEEVIAGIRALGRSLREQESPEEEFNRKVVLPERINSEGTSHPATAEEQFHFPELEKLKETEDIVGIIPTPAMVRAVMERAMLPRKYKRTKHDTLTNVVATSMLGSVDLQSSSSNVTDPNAPPIFRKHEIKGPSMCVCQRCFRLQVYGTEKDTLRPGWSDVDSITPDKFVDLLSVIKTKKAVVLCIIDVFDIKGSLIENLRSIAGKNPIVIAVNKVDLLPRDASSKRVKDWIHKEVKRVCGFVSQKEADATAEEYGKFNKKGLPASAVLRPNDVHLVSCATKLGIPELMNRVNSIASEHSSTVYVMGAANVGKSSFINLLLEYKYKDKRVKPKVKPRAGSKAPRDTSPQATVSPLPGTTLNFLKIKLHNGLTVVDTPGLIASNQLTSRLTTEELKYVIPKRKVTAVTLRLEQGRCVMIGGLASITMLEGKPFFFTFFVSSEVPIRPMLVERVPDFIENHIGENKLLFPPMSKDRYDELLPIDNHMMTIDGEGWLKSSTDICIAGLGWVAVTGAGSCRVAVTAPSGVTVHTREALLPFEASVTHARFTGGRLELTGREDKRGFRR